MTTKVRLVIFDLAGTIVDYGSQAPVGAFRQAFAEAGVAVTPAEARGPMGMHKKAHIRAMLEQPDLAGRWRATLGRDWAEADVERLYARVTPLQSAAVASTSSLTPFAAECIAALRSSDVKVALNTGYFAEAAETVFRLVADQGVVTDFQLHADAVPAGRPAPWMIYRTMESLGVYPARAVVKVGDTRQDILEGKNAGVVTGGVIEGASALGLSLTEWQSLTASQQSEARNRVRAEFDAAGADFVVDHLGQLPGLILG